MRRRRPWPGPGAARLAIAPTWPVLQRLRARSALYQKTSARPMTRFLNLGPVQEARRSIRGSTAAAGECRRIGAPSKPRAPGHSCLNSPVCDRRTVTLVRVPAPGCPGSRCSWLSFMERVRLAAHDTQHGTDHRYLPVAGHAQPFELVLDNENHSTPGRRRALEQLMSRR